MGGDAPMVAPPARASAKRKVQQRFTTSCDVAFLLRIRSLNLLYISRKHFLRYNAFTLCNGEFGMSHPA